MIIRRNFALTLLRVWFAGRRRGLMLYRSHSSDNCPLPCQRRWRNMPE